MSVEMPPPVRGPAVPTALPVTTYRLQLRPEFGFEAAAAAVPYLAELGVTDAYLSPVFVARPGSTHGYDICDHRRLNPELGGEAGFARLEQQLAAHGLGALLDVVPNHMGIDPRTNRWWRDVLENGPSSPFSAFFDIDWDPVKPELKDRVLLPILGDQYGAVLERGELRVALADGALELHYFDHCLPLNPRQVPRALEADLDGVRATLGGDHPHLLEFLSVLRSLQHLPPYGTRDIDQVAERQREKEVARGRLARLLAESVEVHAHVERCVRRLNGEPGQPGSFAELHDLLERQAYRLAYWRTAFDEINYRRFFDVNELAGLRTEHAAVFEDTHALLRDLVTRGVVRGLRVDHPDGLFDPREYFERVRALAREASAAGTAGAAPGEAGDARPFYLVAEKILEHGESLPHDWPVAGTTGYGFLTKVNALLVDRAGLTALTRTWARVTGERRSFADVAYECKKVIMLSSLASELNVLAHAMNVLSEGSWRTRDFTLNSCRRALLELIACLPVYRTYVTEAGASEADRAAIAGALAAARQRNPAMESTIFDFLEQLLLPSSPEHAGVAMPPASERLAFAMKLQQYTGPVHAKGVEDTAFYRYNALTSLNEVGGDPHRGAVTADEFHEANLRRAREWPREMIATATHDTKRGEDHRARLNALSEFPDEWRVALGQWMRINAPHRTVIAGRPAPSRHDEYLFYQALVGAWPAQVEAPRQVPAGLRERLSAFMVKAVREAKTRSSWVNPNDAYERAVGAFVDGVLASHTTALFLTALAPLLQPVAAAGVLNSLAQLTLKIASPGVADFYQGVESWDLSLVDPDNRGVVDFGQRHARLRELLPWVHAAAAPAEDDAAATPAEFVAGLLEHWPDARIKTYVTACGLRLRRTHPDLCVLGDYMALRADDVGEDHLVAFARRHGDAEVVAVVPRTTRRLRRPGQWLPVGAPVWGTSRLVLPPESAGVVYRHLFTGELVRARTVSGDVALLAAEVLRTCPVALLWRQQ